MVTQKATSSKTTLAEKPEESIADHNRADKASDAFLVGVDNEGREHVFSRIRNRVTVLNDGDHEHTEALANRSISTWMAFVDQDDIGGWDTKRYSDGPAFEGLIETLEAGYVEGAD